MFNTLAIGVGKQSARLDELVPAGSVRYALAKQNLVLEYGGLAHHASVDDRDTFTRIEVLKVLVRPLRVGLGGVDFRRVLHVHVRAHL